MVLTPGSHESDPQGSSQKWGSPSLRDSTSDADKGLDDVLDNLDKGTLCSHETDFESNLCVQDLSIRLSWGMLERSAKAYSVFRAASGDTGSGRGVMRQMALSAIE